MKQIKWIDASGIDQYRHVTHHFTDDNAAALRYRRTMINPAAKYAGFSTIRL